MLLNQEVFVLTVPQKYCLHCLITGLHSCFHIVSKNHCKPIWCFVELHSAPHVEVKDVLEVQVLLKIMMVLQNTGEPSIFNLK